jgi:hypothetical protein
MFSMVVSKSNSWVNFAILIPTTTFFCQQVGCFEEWLWLCSRNLQECRQRLLPELKDGTSGSISQTSAHAQVLLPAIPINQMAYIVKATVEHCWLELTFLISILHRDKSPIVQGADIQIWTSHPQDPVLWAEFCPAQTFEHNICCAQSWTERDRERQTESD